MVLLKVPHNRRLRPPSLGSRFAPSPCALIVTLLSLVLLPHVSVVRGAVDMTNAKYNVPYSDCQRDPTLRKAKVGAGVDSVLALCLKSTTSLETTFENANKFFIGNMSNVASFGALCVEIAQTLAMDDDNVLYETPLPPFFMRQGFALSIWGPAPDPNLYNETVVMTLVNDGVSSLSLTGIDFAAIGEDPNFEVPPQGTVTITFNRTQAALDFETLPLLQNYLSDSSTMAIDELTAVVIVKMFPDDPSGLLGRAAYVFIDPTFDSRNPYQFYLFEANYYLPTAGSGRRRLLASIPKTTTPPAGSQKGCCKKTPPRPTCKVGGVNYPACRNPVCKTPC
ncbi:unnamed protein product [Closterium sp. Naga37s-1]|nr:unnamed protein product [Closterium sp. Naga37s-1]